MEQILCTYKNGNDDIVQQGFKQIILAVMSVMGAIEKKNISVRTKNSLAQRRAKGLELGRPKLVKPQGFEEICLKACNGEISHVKAMEMLKLKKTSYYKLVKQLQDEGDIVRDKNNRFILANAPHRDY